MVLLYHYTDKYGMEGIYEDKKIRAFIPSDGSSTSRGVYFTELPPPPDTTKEDLMRNNFDNQPESREKVKFWFAFNLIDLPRGTIALNMEDGNMRNVWKCPAPVSLEVAVGRRAVYHYTNEEGKNAIMSTGVIKPNWPFRGKGTGFIYQFVYFTEMEPTTSLEDLMFNIFGTRDTENKKLVEKTQYHFKIYIDELPFVHKSVKPYEWICRSIVGVKEANVTSYGHIQIFCPFAFMAATPRYQTNLLENTCGQYGLSQWTVLSNDSDVWTIESPPVCCRPIPNIVTYNMCFATSHAMGKKTQRIDLEKHGFTATIMEKQPQIEISEWFARRLNHDSMYYISVTLLNKDMQAVATFTRFKELVIPDWIKLTHVFANYGNGVRYIDFCHGCYDLVTSSQHQGCKITGSRVQITNVFTDVSNEVRTPSPKNRVLESVSILLENSCQSEAKKTMDSLMYSSMDSTTGTAMDISMR